MKDRLILKTTKLKNGITVYTKHMDVPFAIASITIPIGHRHNIGKILSGTAHFLEHIICNRSELYPEKHKFNKIIELAGGSFDASTNSTYTNFSVTVGTKLFNQAFKGLMSHVFNPIFNEEDIKSEAEIILSELKRQGKFAPYGSQLEHYCNTQWMNDASAPIRMRLGNESDLKKMNTKNLSALHQHYFDANMYVIVGGTFDEKAVFEELSRLKTKKQHLPMYERPSRWNKRKYHEKKFTEEIGGRYIYHMGGFVDKNDALTSTAIQFVGDLLTNTVHGSLYEWIRNDLGWAYEMGFTSTSYGMTNISSEWEIYIPLHNKKQVQHIRKEIHERILKTISNEKIIKDEIRRSELSKPFQYQTLSKIISDAESLILFYGRIYNEKEISKMTKAMNPTYLREIYDKYFSPKVVGEFLAIPK